MWGAAVTSELISWCLRLEGTGSLTWEPLLWLVDVAGRLSPSLGRVRGDHRSDSDSACLDEFSFKQTPLGFSPEAVT